jgi:adenine-specific DNA-methyltransferase
LSLPCVRNAGHHVRSLSKLWTGIWHRVAIQNYIMEMPEPKDIDIYNDNMIRVSEMKYVVNLEEFPSTRYRGSKRKVLPWLYENMSYLEFDTVLDAFSGTSSVSFLFKKMGKEVTSNDFLTSNYHSSLAFIQNKHVTLEEDEIEFIVTKNDYDYPSFIQDTFKGIYFKETENQWLDMVIKNIEMLSDICPKNKFKFKRALAYHALFQACMSKRPYNLFHRNNLNMRLATVNRSFNNHKTWETPFETMFAKFCNESNNKVFDNGRRNKTKCIDILNAKKTDYDLVYFDPPYFKEKRTHDTDYLLNYHFLEGILNYSNWDDLIDYKKKHKPLKNNTSSWSLKDVEKNMDRLFNKFSDSTIVLSYGSPGEPSIKRITELLEQYKNDISIKQKKYNYSLNRASKNGSNNYETLIIAR